MKIALTLLQMNLPYYLGTKINEYVEWFVNSKG
jgi:hypothetical protein